MIEPNAPIKVLLPARLIPTGSVVSKVSGTYTYTLSRGLKLYANGTESQTKEIVPAPNTVFLLDQRPNASINQYSDDLVLAWHTTPQDLWLQTEDDSEK